jgi:hypothetical protein
VKLLPFLTKRGFFRVKSYSLTKNVIELPLVQFCEGKFYLQLRT